MMFITHLAFALFLGLLAQRIFSLPVFMSVFLALALLGALLPDIDSADSFIGRKVKPLSIFFKHRGFFHSIIAIVFFTIIVFLIAHNPYYALAFAFGYLSHLLLDSLTRGGVAFFWPSKMRTKGIFRTMGIVDLALLLLFALLDLSWLL